PLDDRDDVGCAFVAVEAGDQTAVAEERHLALGLEPDTGTDGGQSAVPGGVRDGHVPAADVLTALVSSLTVVDAVGSFAADVAERAAQVRIVISTPVGAVRDAADHAALGV